MLVRRFRPAGAQVQTTCGQASVLVCFVVFPDRLVSPVLALIVMIVVGSAASAQSANEPTREAVRPLAYAGFGLTSSVGDLQKAYSASRQ